MRNVWMEEEPEELEYVPPPENWDEWEE